MGVKYPVKDYGYKDLRQPSAITLSKTYMHMNNVNAQGALLMHRLFTESF